MGLLQSATSDLNRTNASWDFAEQWRLYIGAAGGAVAVAPQISP